MANNNQQKLARFISIKKNGQDRDCRLSESPIHPMRNEKRAIKAISMMASESDVRMNETEMAEREPKRKREKNDITCLFNRKEHGTNCAHM